MQVYCSDEVYDAECGLFGVWSVLTSKNGSYLGSPDTVIKMAIVLHYESAICHPIHHKLVSSTASQPKNRPQLVTDPAPHTAGDASMKNSMVWARVPYYLLV